MAWSGWPPATGADIQSYAFLIQLWKACRERAIAAFNSSECCNLWPQKNHIWGGGVIESITATTLTDSTQAWSTAPKRWINWNNISAPWEPQDYDVVIDDCDHELVVKAQITDHTATVLTFAVHLPDGSVGDLDDLVTAGVIPSVASLDGKGYAIIKRDGLWYSDRWLAWPNDQELDAGNVEAATTRHVVDGTVSTSGEKQTITVTGSPTGGDFTLQLDGVETIAIAYNASSASVSAALEALANVGAGNASVTGVAGGPWEATFSPMLDDIAQLAIQTNGLTGGTAPSVSVATTTPGPSGGRWTPDEFVGKQLVVFGGAELRRVSITANSTTTLQFAEGSPAWTPSGKYVICDVGDRVLPGRVADKPFWWYGGHTENLPAHHPDDVLFDVNQPTTAISLLLENTSGSGDPCTIQSRPTFDKDFWTAFDEPCADLPDHCYSPDLYKTIRQIQVWLEENCASFVEPRSYDGETQVPQFTAATWFHSAGINSGTSTVATSAGDYYFTISATYEGAQVVYTIVNADDSHAEVGDAIVTDGKAAVSATAANVGKTVIWSAKWTRYYPRRFRYLFEDTIFVPDLNDEEPPAPVDPPAIFDYAMLGCQGRGTWVTRDASSEYAIYGANGLITEFSDQPFVTSELARYVGDNWYDQVEYVSDDSLVDYYDKRFVGQHRPDYQQHKIDQMSGLANSGTTFSLTDDDRNWWNPLWYAGGTLRTETGTADGGSTTSLSDSTKATGEASCFWDPASGRWLGFIVEVEVSAGVWEKRAITGHTGTTISWSQALSATANGKAYQIREPKYELNRWKGRALSVTRANGTTFEATITHSDDNTLFFSPAEAAPVASGWNYQILDPEVGGVWKWNGSAWIKPTGSDPRGAIFHDEQTENLPTKVKAYGRMNNGDYITLDLFDELYRAINKLIHTQAGAGWTADGETSEKEGNSLLGAEGTTAQTQATDDYGDDPGAVADGAPYAGTNQLSGQSGPPIILGVAHVARRANYGTVNDRTTCIPIAIDWYAWAENFFGAGADKFATNGDPVEYQKWSLWLSDSAASIEDRVSSSMLGSLSVPSTWAPIPDPGEEDGRGYAVTNALAILKWQFEFMA